VLVRAAVIACLLALLPACAGGGDDGEATSDGRTLAPSSFAEVVAAELAAGDVEAEPGPGPSVQARQGPNRLEVDLREAFAEYEASPGREDEIVAGAVATAREELAEGISGTPLDRVREDVMPLLKPRFELRTYGFEPAQSPFPAGLAVVYAVDTGEAFTLVRPADVERWETSVADLHALALENLERRTDEEEPLLCEPSGGQKLCGWASGDGYDASRMIVPGLREQIEEELGGPAAYSAPMENVFVALSLRVLQTGDTEELLRMKLERDFQTSDDPLSPEIFVERRGELVRRG
jgi:uncharacterized protein YtpQ (UPF0354 family)